MSRNSFFHADYPPKKGKQEMTDVPNVWIIYDDKKKNIQSAERYGSLKEMFTGWINYSIAIKQAIKMFEGRYKQNDYLLVVGDPKLVAIVITVAEKYYSENGRVNLLCWNKREQEYYPETFEFPDIEENDDLREEVKYPASTRI